MGFMTVSNKSNEINGLSAFDPANDRNCSDLSINPRSWAVLLKASTFRPSSENFFGRSIQKGNLILIYHYFGFSITPRGFYVPLKDRLKKRSDCSRPSSLVPLISVYIRVKAEAQGYVGLGSRGSAMLKFWKNSR